MSSKFPFSMENIPRQRSFGCLSLRFSTVLTSLIVILYSVMALGSCIHALETLPAHLSTSDAGSMAVFGFVIGVTITHAVTLFLSAIMLVGALKEQKFLIRPWVTWMSMQVVVLLLMFVFWSTMNMINHFANSSLLVYLVEFLGLLIRFYMLVLVGSYYKQLEEERGEYETLRKLNNSECWSNEPYV